MACPRTAPDVPTFEHIIIDLCRFFRQCVRELSWRRAWCWLTVLRGGFYHKVAIGFFTQSHPLAFSFPLVDMSANFIDDFAIAFFDGPR